MGVKRNDRRSCTEHLRSLHQIAHQLLMTEVHSVEVAYGRNRIGTAVGQILQRVEYFHIGLQLDHLLFGHIFHSQLIEYAIQQLVFVLGEIAFGLFLQEG